MTIRIVFGVRKHIMSTYGKKKARSTLPRVKIFKNDKQLPSLFLFGRNNPGFEEK